MIMMNKFLCHFYKIGFFLSLTLSIGITGCSAPKKNYAPVWGETVDQVKKEEKITNKKIVTRKITKKRIKPSKKIKPKKIKTVEKGKVSKRVSARNPLKSNVKNKSVPLNGDDYHIVRRGDTLYSIGFTFGVGYQNLAIWNKIPPPYGLKLGQKIKLFTSKQTQKKEIKKQEKIKNPIKNRSSSQKIAVVERRSSQKKVTISNDKKKLLKFNCRWPIEGKILNDFSQTGRKGIDIKGTVGQKVKSVAVGKVVYSGSGLKGYGNLLIIKHNYLYLSAYANNRHLLVKEGDLVKKGQVIAEVGGAVGKTASLHFEIRKNGSPVNPLEYLPKK